MHFYLTFGFLRFKDVNKRIFQIFTATETITNLTQYKLSQEEFKAGLYFSIQPDKIRKFELFTTFEKIKLIVRLLTILNPTKPKVR